MLSFGASPSNASPSIASPSLASPSVASPSIAGRDWLFADEPSHKKLRSSPAYRSDEQIRAFYQALEAERIKQIERKEDRDDSES